MTRAAYRFLLLLHPADFRRRFGPELLWIFDEASSSGGGLALLVDGLTSLARQWFLRSPLLKWAIATALATLPLLFSFGSFLPWDKPMRP